MICKVCDKDDDFYEEGGFFYCDCGALVDDIIVTGVDDGDLVGEGGGTRGATYQPKFTRRRPTEEPITPSKPRHTKETACYSQFLSHLTSANKKIPKPATASASGNERTNLFREVKREPADFGAEQALSYEDYYKETRDRYVYGFLMMITYQCDALVDKFNVTPLIIGLIGPICLRFVALSGVFDDDWADNAIHNSELQTQGLTNKRSKLHHKDEPRSFDGKRAVMIWLSQLRKSLPLPSSLALSFLACHKAGAPILPTDIVRWAQEGKIPYQSCFLKIQEQMGKRSAACSVDASVMFRPNEIVSAQRLEARAALIAHVIGLALPPVNFYGIALNYLKRLSIPEDKVLDLVRLLHKWSMPSDLYLSKNVLRLPTRVCVMSVLIVAIRMVYNINGFGVWERSLGLDISNEADVDSLFDDEEVSETKSAAKELSDETEELLKNLEAKYDDVAAETVEYEKEDLLSYLSHGKNELFVGLDEASADDTYKSVDNLWKGYTKDTTSKRGRDWEDDLLFNQLSLDDDTKFSDGNNPCSESRSMDHDKEEKAKEGEIRRLRTDMKENFFCYIPPRVKVKRLDYYYLHYARKKEDGGLIYAAHADYYILLRVCARFAEIDARNMHRGVMSFERRLAWIEKRIDQVLHLTPPVMTCDYHRGDVTEDQNSRRYSLK